MVWKARIISWQKGALRRFSEPLRRVMRYMLLKYFSIVRYWKGAEVDVIVVVVGGCG